MRSLLLVPLTLVLLASPASAQDTTTGGSAAVGFPIALAVLAVVAVVVALVWRQASRRRERQDR